MRFAEIKRNILNIPHPEYKIVHCVSADLVMGKGVAEQIAQKYTTEVQQMRKVIEFWKRKYDKYDKNLIGKCITAGTTHFDVYHLVTKEKYNHKPTYETLALSLHDLRRKCIQQDVKKLAMPTIGCGLDKLEWKKVRLIVQGIFSDTEIDIVVCHKNEVPKYE